MKSIKPPHPTCYHHAFLDSESIAIFSVETWKRYVKQMVNGWLLDDLMRELQFSDSKKVDAIVKSIGGKCIAVAKDGVVWCEYVQLADGRVICYKSIPVYPTIQCSDMATRQIQENYAFFLKCREQHEYRKIRNKEVCIPYSDLRDLLNDHSNSDINAGECSIDQLKFLCSAVSESLIDFNQKFEELGKVSSTHMESIIRDMKRNTRMKVEVLATATDNDIVDSVSFAFYLNDSPNTTIVHSQKRSDELRGILSKHLHMWEFSSLNARLLTSRTNTRATQFIRSVYSSEVYADYLKQPTSLLQRICTQLRAIFN